MAKDVKKFSDDLARAISAVNNDVACEMPPRTSKSALAEVCIDAGRLGMWGFKKEQEELNQHFKDRTYNAVHREAMKHVCQY